MPDFFHSSDVLSTRLDNADWPVFGWVTDLRPHLANFQRDGETIVLGTLVRVIGPSPRPAGSQMIFSGTKAAGYFSGGCLEADVANHAQAVLCDGKPRRLVYGKGSPWLDIRLLCGGTLEILLERIGPSDSAVSALQEYAGARKPALWISDGYARRVESVDTARPPDIGAYRIRHDPPWRVIVIGWDPIALATASLAHSAGFETTLVRPHGPAEPPPLAGVRYSRQAAATAIRHLQPDSWTAIVSATHDDETDDSAVISALRARAAYVGVLGSASRMATRRERLLAAGLPPTLIAKLHMPIGAVRCGKAPWEVAVSIIAEIMQARTDQATFEAKDRCLVNFA